LEKIEALADKLVLVPLCCPRTYFIALSNRMLVEETVALGILQRARLEWKSKVRICLYRCPTLDDVLSRTKSILHCRRL